MTGQVDLEDLTAHLVRVFPKLDEIGQTVALHLYRRLSQGHPVPPIELTTAVRVPEHEIIGRLRAWPGVYYDDNGCVIGFWGLTIRPMPHRLRRNGVALYAWCAWDTLFLSELIGGQVDIESTCRGSGQPVRLTATPRGVQDACPAGLVLSFLVPDADRVNADVITSFCHYVHFFASPQIAQSWLANHPNSFVLSLADGIALGRDVNRARYGRLLSTSDA